MLPCLSSYPVKGEHVFLNASTRQPKRQRYSGPGMQRRLTAKTHISQVARYVHSVNAANQECITDHVHQLLAHENKSQGMRNGWVTAFGIIDDENNVLSRK